MTKREAMEKLAEMTACKSCGKTALKIGEHKATCSECGAEFPTDRGFIDFAGERGPAATSSQRAMEFKPIVRIYESIWRPVITIFVSSYRWERRQVDQYLGLAAGMTVMDIAPGTGHGARRFAKVVGPDGFVAGVDMSGPMLDQAVAYIKRDGIDNVALLRSDILSCSINDGQFDRVHCSGALHLFEDHPKVFSRIYAWLKPGGIFVGCTYLLGKGEIRRRRKTESGARMGFHWFDPDELEKLAKGAGFENYEASIHREGIVFRACKK